MAESGAPAFVHLHTHSAYSLLEGALHVSLIRDLCLEHAMPAVAVTDTNNLFGALEAAEVLSAAGVQPVTGMELGVAGLLGEDSERRLTAEPKLVLLAQTEAGYANLMKLSSLAFLSPSSEAGPSVRLADLERFGADLLCLTGGYDGPLDTLLRDKRRDAAVGLFHQLSTLFGDRFYVELQRHGRADEAACEEVLLDLSYEAQVPLVATNEPYFATAEIYPAHDALMCIAEGAYIHQDDRRRLTPEHYFKSSSEMSALFEDLPEAIEQSLEIATRCAVRPRTRPPILPNFMEDAGGDEHEELTRQARAGLTARLNAADVEDRDAYDARLAHELGIIEKMGFPGYFLIVADFIKWAKARGIPVGPGRGSGAGSVVAWALTITDLDPLRFGLLFERFLNPERISMPDFDIDFCQDRRDEVIRYVQERYGADRVAQIITFGKLQARAVLRDVGRVLNMSYGQVDRLCKMVPNNPANPVTLAEAIEQEPRLQEARDEEAEVADLLDKALRLEGLYRHASTHAAGVVIGDRPLDELTPLYKDSRSDMPATQFNMKWVEPAGLVKFDFLGLKTLTVLDRAKQLIERGGGKIDLDHLPLDDAQTFKMLGEGASTGVFQLESAGMRSVLKALKPDSLEDIIALVSLYRPGPMENIPTYIDCKSGRKAPDYLHPTLEPILKETYGVIIYQEQVMQIAQILSGYSLGEADLLRRAMGKKKKEEMEKQKIRFLDGARDQGVDVSKAESIFELVAKFAGYGFNKSHAAAYAWIAYQTAFLKANHAPEFLAASMSLDAGLTDKLAVFVNEAKRIDVPVRAPDINHSEAEFTVQDGAILYALGALKNVGLQAMEDLVREREDGGAFRDLDDFARRIDPKSLNKRGLEGLVRAGAFDALSLDRSFVFENIDRILKVAARSSQERNSSQGGLFAAVEDVPAAESWTPAAKWTTLRKLDEEGAAVGFYLSGHPLDDYDAPLKRLKVVASSEISEKARGARAVAPMAGVVRSVRRRRSKTGKPFAWIEVSDRSGAFEVTAFSETLNAAGDLLEVGRLVMLSVVAEDRDGDLRLTCEGVRALEDAAAQSAATVRIFVDRASAIEEVRSQLSAHQGDAAPSRRGGEVFLVLLDPGAGREIEMKLEAGVPAGPAVCGALRAIDGVAEVELA